MNLNFNSLKILIFLQKRSISKKKISNFPEKKINIFFEKKNFKIFFVDLDLTIKNCIINFLYEQNVKSCLQISITKVNYFHNFIKIF